MIFIDTPFYASVWSKKVSDNGKYIDLQISTRDKDKDGNVKYSSWFPRCIGHAVNTLKDLTPSTKETRGDSIKVTKAKITNEKYKDKDGNMKSSLSLVIIEAEIYNGNKQENTQTVDEKPAKAEETTEEDSPW